MGKASVDPVVIQIKTALVAQGIRQTAIAKANGVSPAMVSLYIRGMSRSAKLDEWFEREIGVSHAKGADN